MKWCSTHRDPILLVRLLSETIDKASPYIRLQDATYVYRAVGATGEGRRVQFDWVKDNFAAIKVIVTVPTHKT